MTGVVGKEGEGLGEAWGGCRTSQRDSLLGQTRVIFR